MSKETKKWIYWFSVLGLSLFLNFLFAKALWNVRDELANTKNLLYKIGYDNDRLRNENLKMKEEIRKLKIEKQKLNVMYAEFPMRAKIIEVVFKKAPKYGFDPLLILAVIKNESNFNPYARSPVAYGLMQINYSVWKDKLKIDFNKIYDIEYNIELGLKILQHYYKLNSGDLSMALHNYNNGFVYNNLKYTPMVLNILEKYVN